jgi:hypothetical protein
MLQLWSPLVSALLLSLLLLRLPLRQLQQHWP